MGINSYVFIFNTALCFSYTSVSTAWLTRFDDMINYASFSIMCKSILKRRIAYMHRRFIYQINKRWSFHVAQIAFSLENTDIENMP